MVVITTNSCVRRTMSSLPLPKQSLMNTCFRSVLDTILSDRGSILRPKRTRKRNQRTKFLLLSFSLMMMNRIILPNLSERTRARRETSHLHRHRLNLSMHHRKSECNSQSRQIAHCRRLLHRSELAHLHRVDLGESGKSQLARAMSMVNHGTQQTFLRTLKRKHRGETWLNHADSRVALNLRLDLLLGMSHRFPDLALPN